MNETILKPGFMISLHTRKRGGVTYNREELEMKTEENGESVRVWRTTRRIDDPTSFAEATRLQGAARGIITKLCTNTAFGLLCPLDREEALSKAMAEARDLCDEWNALGNGTTVHVYALKGRVASTDEEATRAIAAEVEGLMQEMERGIANLDVKAVRDAASRAKEIGEMLDGKQADGVGLAVENARKAAREITKRVVKGAENADKVLADLGPQRAALELARASFLEIADSSDAPPPVSQASDGDLARFGGLEIEEKVAS